MDNPGSPPAPSDDEDVLTPREEWAIWWWEQAAALHREHPGLEVACRQGFVLRTDQLADAGVSRAQVRTLVRRGTWWVPERGTVALVDPSDANLWTVRRRRHALACAAAALRNPGFAVASTSCAILHGLATLDVPPRPQLIAPLVRHAHRRGKATVPASDLTNWFGVPVLAPARTVVDIARHDRRGGLVVADSALYERVVSRGDLERTLAAQRGWCGVRTAREVAGLADGLAESPLESITRLALHDDRFPPPELQVEFDIPGRRFPYRVDLYWPEFGVILECDGRIKYSEDAAWKDKRRDTALHRASGATVERVVWADVDADWPATSAYLWTVLGLPVR